MYKLLIALCLCLFAFACGGTEYDVEDEALIEEELRINNTGTTDGGACKVSSGTHTGKSGTYETDDDGYKWCCGDWGCTECTSGACSSAIKTSVYNFGSVGTVYSGP